MEVREFDIPVPWGKIAAKAYGDEQNPIVLALHGALDNAGSFDSLLPLLPNSFYYISFDLPGHGKSSPFPPHTFIMDLNHIYSIKLVTNYLKIKKCVMMGHCRGGQYFIFFSQLYPELVEKIIVFDSYYLIPEEVEGFNKSLVMGIDCLIKTSANQENAPEYTYEDALTKLIKGNIWGTLTRTSGELMLNRIIEPTGAGKYRFTMDPRLKALRKVGYSKDFAIEYLKKHPILHPCLFVVASRSQSFLNEHYGPMLETIKKYNNNVSLEVVIGGHYVHVNNPEVVAPVVAKYLTFTSSNL